MSGPALAVNLVALTGVPGLSVAVEAGLYIAGAIEEVKVYKQQGKDLSARCSALLAAVQDETAGLDGTRSLQLWDEVEYTLLRVRNKVNEWAHWSRVKSFVQRADIKESLDRFNKEIDTCLHKFNISINLELSRGTREMLAVQERDRAEMRETLQAMLRNTEDLRVILGMQEPAVVDIMQTIQKELHDPGLDHLQEQGLRKGLWDLYENTSLLPPMTDLTGQVVRISQIPIAFGFFNDIYAGEWLDREKVALRLSRALGNLPMVQKRFHNEVKVWRALKPHPNVVPLYGIVYMGENLYSVSPWMDHGNAINYVKNQPRVDRTGLLLQVAEGLEHLHLNQVVHGDLRGANVLISKDGTARLTDFGLSKFLEEEGQNQSAPAGVNPRWFAAELVRETGSVSTYSDVWSFGMLMLEIFTGEQPFANIPRDLNVILALAKGQLPERPGHPGAYRGLTEGVWTLMMQCWHNHPPARPSMTVVKASLTELYVAFEGRLPNQPPTPSTPAFPPPPRPTHTYSNSIPIAPSTSGLSGRIASPGPLFDSELTASPPKGGLVYSTPTPSKDILRKRPSTGGSVKSPKSPTSPHRKWSTKLSTLITGKRAPEPSPVSPAPPSAYTMISSPNPPFINDDCFLEDSGPFFFPARSIALQKSQSTALSMEEYTRSSQSIVEIEHVSVSVPANFGSHFPEKPPSEYSSAESSSRTSATSASLRRAIKHLEPVVLRNGAGAVQAGTLEGLVGAMITDSGESRPAQEEYRDAFLRSYSAFTTSEDVYKILVCRYHEEDASKDAQERAGLRYNIVAVLKRWVAIPDVLIDMHVLREMKEYALHVTTSRTMSTLAKDIVATIEKRLKDSHDPRFSSSTMSSTNTPIPRSTDIKPSDLAIAMTILDGFRYRRILPVDCLYYVQGASPTTIREARETHNRIGYWVTKSILRYDKLDTRVEVLKFMINVAEECRILRNYNSMAAVASSLNSAPITALKLTRQELDSQNAGMLERILALLNPVSNHRQYRNVLDSSSKPCVPWVGVHLRDIILLFNKHETPAVVPSEGHSLIDFTRYRSFGELMHTLLQYRVPEFDDNQDKGPLAYLEHQLSNIPVDSKRMDVYFTERSQDLQQREQKMHAQRSLELGALGFKTHHS